MSLAEQIEQQAAAFVWRAETASSPQEDRERDHWLAQSPRHRAAFLRLSTAWRTTDALWEMGGAVRNIKPARGACLSPLILALLTSVSSAAAIGHMMTFKDVTIAEATQLFNNHNARQLIVTDPAISQRRIAGNFSLDDPERFAASLEQVLDIKVVRSGEQIRLVPNERAR